MNWKYYKPKFEYEEKFQDAGWPWAGHKNFAYDFVRNIKPASIVELGTHMGTSFFSFCQAAKDEKIDIKLSAVDTWSGDEHAGFYTDSVFNWVNKLKTSYYEELKIDLIRETFDDAMKNFSNKSIDLLHIDGLHTYDAVKHDFEFWLEKVKDDGVILFHDVVEKSDDFGVYILWEELKKKYKTLEFHHSHGLGILFLNPKKYEALFDFQQIWQNYYSILAENKLLYFDVYKKERKIDNQNKNIQQKGAEIQQKDQVIHQKDADIQQKDSEIQQKEAEIRQNKVEIQQKEKIAKDRNVEIRLMKSSKFWKMREKYINLKNKLRIK